MNWIHLSIFVAGCILSFIGGAHHGARTALAEVRRQLRKGGAL